jgi:beta-lactamase class A
MGCEAKTDTTELVKRLESMNREHDISFAVHDAKGKPLYAQQADKKIPSASVIKILILVELFRQVEEGLISLEQTCTVNAEDIVGGAGELQFLPPGGNYSVEYLAKEMIRISDNIATNLIIRLVDMENVNRLAAELGLKQSELKRYMMDFTAIEEGRQNYTSPADMNRVLLMLLQGNILTRSSREKIIGMLTDCVDKTLIKGQLPGHLQVANKTGTLDYVRADAAIVYGKKPLVISIFIEHFEDRDIADRTVAELAALIWKTFGKEPLF